MHGETDQSGRLQTDLVDYLGRAIGTQWLLSQARGSRQAPCWRGRHDNTAARTWRPPTTLGPPAGGGHSRAAPQYANAIPMSERDDPEPCENPLLSQKLHTDPDSERRSTRVRVCHNALALEHARTASGLFLRPVSQFKSSDAADVPSRRVLNRPACQPGVQIRATVGASRLCRRRGHRVARLSFGMLASGHSS